MSDFYQSIIACTDDYMYFRVDSDFAIVATDKLTHEVVPVKSLRKHEVITRDDLINYMVIDQSPRLQFFVTALDIQSFELVWIANRRYLRYERLVELGINAYIEINEYREIHLNSITYVFWPHMLLPWAEWIDFVDDNNVLYTPVKYDDLDLITCKYYTDTVTYRYYMLKQVMT